MAFEGHGETPSGEAGGVGVLAAPGGLSAGGRFGRRIRRGMERLLGRCCVRRPPDAALAVLGSAERQRGEPLPLPLPFQRKKVPISGCLPACNLLDLRAPSLPRSYGVSRFWYLPSCSPIAGDAPGLGMLW